MTPPSTTPTRDNRRLFTIPVRPEMYDQIKRHCAEREIPMTVFARELFKQALAKADRG